MALKKGDKVILCMFTGCKTCVKEVVEANKKTITIVANNGKELIFDAKTMKQIEPAPKSEKFANYIMEDDGSFVPKPKKPRTKKPKKEVKAEEEVKVEEEVKTEEPVVEVEPDEVAEEPVAEVEEEVKPKKKSKKKAEPKKEKKPKKAKVEEEEETDWEDDEEFDEDEFVEV